MFYAYYVRRIQSDRWDSRVKASYQKIPLPLDLPHQLTQYKDRKDVWHWSKRNIPTPHTTAVHTVSDGGVKSENMPLMPVSQDAPQVPRF